MDCRGQPTLVLQLLIKKWIVDMEEKLFVPGPVISPSYFIAFEDAIYWKAMNEVLAKFCSHDIIESAHVSGVGGMVICIVLFVDSRQAFNELSHNRCSTTHDP